MWTKKKKKKESESTKRKNGVERNTMKNKFQATYVENFHKYQKRSLLNVISIRKGNVYAVYA